jgi:hypothetical protein
MSKRDKREQKIRADIKNVSLEDFEALINQYGYIKEGARHPKAIIGKRVYPYKRTNPVNVPYVEKLIEIIDDLSKQGKSDE